MKTIKSILFIITLFIISSASAQSHKTYSEPRDREIFESYIKFMKGKERLPIEKVVVERHGQVRRAKLTYLRGRIGKSALAVKEKDPHLSRKKS